jgi:phosphate transport system substrate-binding protein
VEQVAGIFRGTVKNWREVGGPDQPIDAFSRERNSGTHHYFLEEVVRLGKSKAKEQFAPEVAMMPSSQAIYDEVAENPRAIGYYGLGYLGPRNKALAIAKGKKPATLPSVANALAKTYPIARPLFIYTAGEPEGALAAFIDFVLSDAGQQVALDEDFVPLFMPGSRRPADPPGSDAAAAAGGAPAGGAASTEGPR